MMVNSSNADQTQSACIAAANPAETLAPSDWTDLLRGVCSSCYCWRCVAGEDEEVCSDKQLAAAQEEADEAKAQAVKADAKLVKRNATVGRVQRTLVTQEAQEAESLSTPLAWDVTVPSALCIESTGAFGCTSLAVCVATDYDG